MSDGATPPTTTPPTTTPPAATPPETTDPELDRLKREREKLRLRQEIAAARASALASISPALGDAPKGEVTLEEKAGSLAPWLTHRALALAASKIATDVRNHSLDPAPAGGLVILVTEDPGLLVSDVISRQVLTTINLRKEELDQTQTYVTAAASNLESDISAYRDREKESLSDSLDEEVRRWASALGAETVLALDTESAETAGGTDEEEDAAASSGAGEDGGPFGAAVDLIRLLATDFTLTSAAVSVRSAVLAALVAGKLKTVRPPDEAAFPHETAVVLDGLTVAGEQSTTLAAYDRLIRAANRFSLEIQKLRSRAASVAAEATDLRAAADKVRADWTGAITNKDVTPERAKELKAGLDELTLRLSLRAGAASAAQAAADSAAGVLTAARADLTALITVDTKGISPLLRTCSREGLHGASPTITHVLHVESTQAAADVVTRRSILGSSGRIGYLAGINTTWTLAETSDGRVVVGGEHHPAIQMTHDLTSGISTENPVITSGQLKSDPLVLTEWVMRAVVVILALGIAALGVAAVAAVFF